MPPDSLLHSIKTLPPFPETAGRALQAIQDGNSSTQDVVDIIQYDPNITTNVLRLCNSAYFGFRTQVGSLKQAVTLLGLGAVMELVMISGSLSLYNEDVSGYGIRSRVLWRHSVACGLLAQILSKRVSRVDPATLFTAGLLHDIGKVVLNSFVRDRFEDIVRLVEEHGYTFVEAEREVLGMDHAAVGAEAAEKWGLPASISVPIGAHHDFERVKQGDPYTVLVYLADRGCKLAGTGIGVDAWSFREFRYALKRAGISEEDMDSSLVELKRDMRRISQVIRIEQS